LRYGRGVGDFASISNEVHLKTFTLTFLVASLFAASASAHLPVDRHAGPVAVAVYNGDIVSLNSDSSIDFVDIKTDSIKSTYKKVAPIGEYIRAQWTDKTGTIHLVETLITGNSKTAMKKTIAKHAARVAAMQAVFPPRKP
jgi:hypothetical protein